MRIQKSELFSKLEQKLKENKFIDNILNEILLISLNDDTVNNKDNIIDLKIKELEETILKQNNMMLKSLKLQEDFAKRILFLDKENKETKYKILNSVN